MSLLWLTMMFLYAFLSDGQGAYAEQVAVAYQQLLPIPDSISFDQAAGMSITWPTSYEGIVGRGEAKKGEFVLVHAGAGGVGQSPLPFSIRPVSSWSNIELTMATRTLRPTCDPDCCLARVPGDRNRPRGGQARRLS